MALKSLVAKKSEIAESAIEAIVSPYVRYYVESSEIGFTPECAAISNDRKVLVYLVAVLGWRYVTDKPPTISTKPADLEDAVSIPGGTLRPVLKALRERHLISEDGGQYSVREGNLDAIAAIVKGDKKVVRESGKPARRSPEKTDLSPKKVKSRKSGDGSITNFMDEWIKDGFFNTPRTLRNVLNRLHEVGTTVERTAVSKPLLRAVKARKLFRKKGVEGGKEMWTYTSTPQKG